MAFKLAELFVEISAKGFVAFSDELRSMRQQLDLVDRSVRFGFLRQFLQEKLVIERARDFAVLRAELGTVGAHLARFGQQIGRFQEQLGAVTGLVRPLQVAAASLSALVAVGLRGTVQANALAFQFERLGRAVGDIFAPIINKVVDIVARLAEFFRGLSDQTRDLIANFALAGVAVLAVATVLPKLVGGISLVVAGIQALTVAFTGLNGVTGGILIVIGAIVTALAAIFLGTEKGRAALGKLFDALKPLFGAFAELASLVIDAFKPLIDLVVELASALIATLVPVLKFVAELIGNMAKNLRDLLEGLGLVKPEADRKAGNRARLEPGGGGFEDVGKVFERVQIAALKADLGAQGKTVEQQQLEVQKQMLEAQQMTNDKLGQLRPAVAR